MSLTFEELATEESDGLYQGALFLVAGNERAAESLLLDTLGRSFHTVSASDSIDDVRAWLEGRLVVTYLSRVEASRSGRSRTSVRAAPIREARPQVFDHRDAKGLYAAAESVPWAARAALWLVLLRRWSYEEACQTLGTDREGLNDLLQHRHTLVGSIIGGGRSRSRDRWAAGS